MIQVLADEKQLSETVEKIMQEKQDEKDSLSNKDVIQRYLEKNGASLGLPPLKNDEVVILLYDIVLGDIENGQTDAASEKDEFMVFLKDILEKFAAQLEVNPTFHDLGN